MSKGITYFSDPTVYLQKSSLFLFPFVGLRKKELHNPINTYLYCDAIEESILDYKLLVLYKHLPTEMFERWESEVLSKHPLVCSCYSTLDGTLYTFDLSSNKDAVDKFLRGDYTKFREVDKQVVCKYHINGLKDVKVDFFTKEDNFLDGSNLFIPSCLYFRELKDKVARDMTQIYSTEMEAKEALRDMKELASIFDLDKETLNTTLNT